MNDTGKIPVISPLTWGLLTLVGIATMVLVAPIRNYDVYDIQGGMRALGEHPALVIGGQMVFAWAGVVLVFMVMAFYDWLPPESRPYTLKAATAFGMISGALFLFFGLAGGLAGFDLRYLQSVRSTAYVQDAYLPLTLLVNRAHIAAITVCGLWFALTNWTALRSRLLPPLVAYTGLGAGVLALFGFVLPGGGFSLLSLLLSAVWGILVGFQGLRGWRSAEFIS